jgi:hypothetical protein
MSFPGVHTEWHVVDDEFLSQDDEFVPREGNIDAQVWDLSDDEYSVSAVPERPSWCIAVESLIDDLVRRTLGIVI